MMKKINKLSALLLFYLLVLTSQFTAVGKNSVPAVEMVSYEQTWLDSNGTIALKNNTDTDIHNVSFQLEYLDMEGKPQDYETFTYDIEIAPGMTKKLDIPAYEHERFYHYYKTKDSYGHPTFKLNYKLKEFNSTIIESDEFQSDSESKEGQQEKRSSDLTVGILMLIVLFFGFGIYVGSYVLVAVMAKRRNRNPVIWLLLSFIATPVLICIILLIVGNAQYPEY